MKVEKILSADTGHWIFFSRMCVQEYQIANWLLQVLGFSGSLNFLEIRIFSMGISINF